MAKIKIISVPQMSNGGSHWIQNVTKSIKRRGTKGVCTGSKFGSSSCPAGSKRYNLAKTFKKMAHKHEDGGEVEQTQQEPKMNSIDIQQGELLISPSKTNPSGWDIIKEYSNPNIYSKHAKNPKKEPIGNFVQAPEGSIVITAEMAKKFKTGDSITKSTIVRNILNRQEKEGTPTIEAPGTTQMSKKGGMVVKAAKGYVDPQGDEVTGLSGYNPWGYDKKKNAPIPFYLDESSFSPVTDPTNPDILPIGNTTFKGFPQVASPSYDARNIDNFGNPTSVNMSKINPTSLDTNPIPDKLNYIPRDYGVNLHPQYKKGSNEDTDWDKILNTAQDILPYAATLAQYPTKIDKAERIRNTKYEQARQELSSLEDVVPIQDQLQAIANQEYTANRNSNYSINPANASARQSQIHANTLNALNEVMGNKARTELQLRNAKRSALSQLDMGAGSEDAQYQAAFNLENAQNKQAVKNARMAVGSNLANIAIQQRNFEKTKATMGTMWKYVEQAPDGSFKFKDNISIGTDIKELIKSMMLQNGVTLKDN